LLKRKLPFLQWLQLLDLIQQKIKWKDAFQGLDQQSLFTPITKKTWTVKNSKIIPKVISDAFSLAMTPRRGPVCVNLPRNILAATNDYHVNTNKAFIL
jgi:thiamine pyrophosphate-dependent acetolactate synthase large subunit-like protein